MITIIEAKQLEARRKELINECSGVFLLHSKMVEDIGLDTWPQAVCAIEEELTEIEQINEQLRTLYSQAQHA